MVSGAFGFLELSLIGLLTVVDKDGLLILVRFILGGFVINAVAIPYRSREAGSVLSFDVELYDVDAIAGVDNEGDAKEKESIGISFVIFNNVSIPF